MLSYLVNDGGEFYDATIRNADNITDSGSAFRE